MSETKTGLIQSFVFVLCIFLIADLFMPSASAQTEPAISETIASIEIKGLSRTKRSVVLNELEFNEGDTVSKSQIELGISNLRNTNLFSSLDYSLDTAESGKTLSITVEERWTTIPIAKFASGGGTTELILGVFDPNVFGLYTEVGAQYQRLGETNSGVAWFKKPRLFGRPLTLDLQYWNTNRLRTKYFPERLSPEILTGFLHKREKIYTGLAYNFNATTSLAIDIENHSDRFSFEYLDEEVKEKAVLKGLPADTNVLFYGMSLKLGRINQNGYLSDGASLTTSYRHGMSKDKVVAGDFDEGTLTALYFKTFLGNMTFAQRIKAGGTTTKILQYWHYLGGLDSIRGFADNRFAGRYYWLSNTEVRSPFYSSPKAVLQATVFHDVVATGEESKDLRSARGASVGCGLRLIMPKIYRLVARLDFAKPTQANDEIPISFGVQQFF